MGIERAPPGRSNRLSTADCSSERDDATPDARAAFDRRRKLAGDGLTRWQGVLDKDLAGANRQIAAAGLTPLSAESKPR